MVRGVLFWVLSGLGVAMMLSSAYVVGEIAKFEAIELQVIFLLFLLSTIHVFRFAVTLLLAKNFDLSNYHPITSIFFVGLIIIGFFRGDEFSFKQIISALAITLGALILTSSQNRNSET